MGAEKPNKVAAIAGIYPVTNLLRYLGISKAARAYSLTPTKLAEQLTTFNLIDAFESLAQAKVPLYVIHGYF
jgi:hypothetical protein